MGVKSKYYYTTPTEDYLAPANTNLVLGHPPEYTEKFYKNLSLMVNPSARVSVNGQEVFVHKALGLQLTADNHEPIYDFRILDDNVICYYIGSW